jgi:Transcriptional regulator
MTQLKRTQSAKDLISETLCNLIEQKKKYQDISISDITNEGWVCRNSFYRIFNSKDDILKEKFSKHR